MSVVKLKFLEGMKITKKGGKLLVDISIAPWKNTAHNYHQEERISYEPSAEIISKGYILSEGLKTELAYYGMPVYVRLHNGTVCDYEKGWTDQYGNPVPVGTEGAYPQPLDTAGTLSDYYHSTAMEDFKKGMISKTSTFKELDMKMIGMIAVIGVGVFFGLFLLMNGGH